MWEGEPEALAEAAAAGRRAAAWMRALPVPEDGGLPVGDWIVGGLADAVEKAMGALDPGDCDGMVDGKVFEGTSGVDAATMETLSGLPFALPQSADWLSPDEQIRLLAVVGTVTATVPLLANDPGTVIMRGELSRMCAILTHATRPALGGVHKPDVRRALEAETTEQGGG
ncbi:hypothetical protein DBP19_36635 [Streptomyces sp. CS090A]|nr:hypothetical protein DBP19_36635 [Streptomyces sp. CS090A]